MFFGFNDDQEDFRASLRRFLAERAPLATVRDAAAGERGYDEAVWRALADQLGLPSLAVPEEYGGAGYTMLEAAVAVEELGRALTPVPYLATVHAAELILALGDDGARKELLPPVAAGEQVATVATTGSVRADGDTLSGECRNVIAGHVADLVVVRAGDAYYTVPAGARGLTAERADTFDLTRPVATLRLDGTPATRLGDATGDAAERATDRIRALLAAEMVGGTDACLAASVGYAKERYQFNRPIGSFQAIKHRCAEMAVELDAARAAAAFAAYAACADSEVAGDLPTAAPLALAQAAEAYLFAAGWNIQIHGGIGFTWEHDAHLYYRRARSAAVLLGSVRANRELLADRAGI